MSKIILITGSNRGLGFSIAQSIAQRSKDACVLVAARKMSSAERAVSDLESISLHADLQPITLDVTDDESVRTCLQEIEKKYGRIDGKRLHRVAPTETGSQQLTSRETSSHQQRRHRSDSVKRPSRFPYPLHSRLRHKHHLRRPAHFSLHPSPPQLDHSPCNQHLLRPSIRPQSNNRQTPTHRVSAVLYFENGSQRPNHRDGQILPRCRLLCC